MKLKIILLAMLLGSTDAFAQTIPASQHTASIYAYKKPRDLAQEWVNLNDIKGQWLVLIDETFETSTQNATTEELVTINSIKNDLKAVDIEQEMVIVYQHTYTSQELELLINFYKTPEGQSILKKNQHLSEKLKDIQIKHIQQLMKKYDATT